MKSRRLGNGLLVFQTGFCFQSEAVNGYNPSHFGVTAGGGIEMHAGGVRLSPTLRYTRWAKDANPFPLPADVDYSRTNANAVELLFGVAF